MIPAAHRMDHLREVISKLLLPNRSCKNPWMTCVFTTKANLDPLYAIAKTMLTTLHHLTRQRWGIVGDLWELACEYQQPCYKTKRMNATGPAASLARLAEHLHWQLLPNMRMQAENFGMVDLHYASSQDLLRCLDVTWDDCVTAAALHRKQWQELHSINITLTKHCCNKLRPDELAILTNHWTGALQSVAMKAHWLPPDEITCPLCDVQMTDDHVVVRCEALREVRAPWEQWITHLPEDMKYLCIMPVAHQIPEESSLRALQAAAGIVFPATHKPQDDARSTFFTDASCHDRLRDIENQAAWAIVAFEQNTLFSVVAGTLEIPLLTTQAYTTSGSLPGRQSVNRAELFAIATVVANTNGGVIVTDSQYALTTVSQILANPDPGEHGDRDNLDIIYALCHVCASKPLQGFQLEKIKSHQPQPEDAKTKAAFYHEGNRLVDCVAKQTLANLPDRQLNTLIRDCHVASVKCRQTTLRAMQCVATMHKAFVQAKSLKSQNPGQPVSQTSSPAPHAVLMPQYLQTEQWPTSVLDQDKRRLMFWGTTYTLRLYQWVQSLRWPKNLQDACSDVTWYELYVNFRLVTQSFVPINQGTKYLPKYVTPDHEPALAFTPTSAAQVLRNFKDSLEYLSTLVDAPLWPATKIATAVTMCKALRRLKTQLGGLNIRPTMQFAEQTAQIIVESTPNFDGVLWALPTVPKVEPLIKIPLQADDDPSCCHLAKSRFKNFHRKRA